ncbi:hypothetical protein COE51_01285 [Bacillus pseudomycoides]|nr:hypothetical protein COE51_01285 [Bacillus pseudomycoides]
MLYKEFSKLIGSKIKAGDEVFICDYRFNDIDNKAIRHVKPQKVVLFSNDDLPKNKTVYYSEYHFRPLNAKGKALSKIIAPYDNTGYRSYTGVSLNIFLTEEECVEHYKQQCEEIIERFEKAKLDKAKYFDEMINEVQEEINNL